MGVLPMRAGKLRHRVAVERASETRDTFGQVDFAWAVVAQRWASVEPLTGRELVHAQQVHSETTHKITMRHIDDIITQDRIVLDSRTFAILSVVNVEERNRETVLMVKETA